MRVSQSLVGLISNCATAIAYDYYTEVISPGLVSLVLTKTCHLLDVVKPFVFS